MILTENGVLKLMQRIKSFITAQLNTKAASVHTHSISEIDDLSNLSMGGGGYTKSEVDTLLNDYIPRSGGAVMTGDLIARNVNNSDLIISGGNAWDQGGVIILRGKNYSNAEGFLSLGAKASDGTGCGVDLSPWGYFLPNTDNAIGCGMSNRRWSTIYSATSTINTSDSRLKNTITDIDDNLLDAWETIQPKQYKFNDATESKGEQARFHTGYLAQDIQKACNDNNLDISKYGLFCYDSWEEEPEITEDVEVEKDGVKTTEKRIVQPKREKGDMYALRYEEALVVECAYLRREVSRLKQQNEDLEQRLKMLEQSVK